MINLTYLQTETPKDLKLSLSEKKDINSDEIPLDNLSDPLDFVDYLEYEKPKKNQKYKNIYFFSKNLKKKVNQHFQYVI